MSDKTELLNDHLIDQKYKKKKNDHEKRKVKDLNKDIDVDNKIENKTDTEINHSEDENQKNILEGKENKKKSTRNASKNKKQKFEEEKESDIATEGNSVDNSKNVLSMSVDNSENILSMSVDSSKNVLSMSVVSKLNVPLPTVRTATPYALFCIDEKMKMKQTDGNYKNYTTSEIIKILSKLWKNLAANIKQEWVVKSNLLQTNKEESFLIDIDSLTEISDDNINEKESQIHIEKDDENQFKMKTLKIQNSISKDDNNLTSEIKLNKKEIISKNKIIKQNDKKVKIKKTENNIDIDKNDKEEEEEEEEDLFDTAIVKKSKTKPKSKQDNKRKNRKEIDALICPPKKISK